MHHCKIKKSVSTNIDKIQLKSPRSVMERGLCFDRTWQADHSTG
nr:MAG TPA: hypothetical protein [Caudoviricetes sp.]